ncbi:MAG: hypothetical protein BWK79_12975, partial [Beggiatoa sp. IS2]
MFMQESNPTLEIDLCSSYHRPDNLFDEMCDPEGRVRPHWEHLIHSLKMLGRDELENRWQEARRLLRDNGVTYNTHGDPQGRDRPWQLDPVPMLISSDEWSVIESGLIQRAELMNLLLADLYGPRETLRKGLLPVELIAIHPEFLRPVVGIPLHKRHRLPLYGVDLVRASDARMWAIADRTQAPPGAGYALENRMVLSRVMPSLFRESHAHRLALFFRTVRSTLASMSTHEDPRIVLLTPGPGSETYFEQAYLANYLGYTLAQGADLTVRDGKVYLKTLDGLQNVDIILRYVNDDFCDPLELRPESFLGVIGLTQAIRMGNVAIANPLGSGLLENTGITAFLSSLAKYFLGEELSIPSPMTWWCGRPKERDYVLANLDKLVIKHIAHSPNLLSMRGKLLSNKQRDLLREQIRAQPYWFVGSEEIGRSTTPVFANGHLEPRQLILRSFLVSNEDSYAVMPGGLTRVSSSTDSPVVSSQSGGLSKDTWVLASEPIRQISLLPQTQSVFVLADGQGELSSRVAENLYWLGRYAERAEGTIRLLRTVLLYLTEPYDFPQDRTALHSLLRAVTCLTDTYPGFVGEGGELKLGAPENELLSVFRDKNRTGSLSSTLQAFLNAARSVRDRVSVDMWRVVNDIDEELNALQQEDSLQINDVLSELDNLITALLAFSGLSSESMTHGQGWRFLMIGRRIERAQHTMDLLRATLSNVNADEMILLEHVLTITDSLLTYRRRYRSQFQVSGVLGLILQSENNPRAIGYQLKRLEEYIGYLPQDNRIPYQTLESRL